ncbi:hypothetical protein ACFWBF_12845 [Streptomyces sp. NPDC060028]|uniref:hypothetical protein n=1 Tax=Streptomyces sp. NPDC060028 TaxID=3347041 RepID=UPI003686BB54
MSTSESASDSTSGDGAGPDRELVERLHRRLDRIESLLEPSVGPGEGRPAWRQPTEGEERWAVTVAILVAVGLQLFLPNRLTVQPHWLLPALEVTLLLALAALNPHRRLDRSSYLLRGLSLSLAASISLANAWSAVKLVRELLHATGAGGALELLSTAGSVWVTNVIAFALWYWEWDRGGPAARAQGTKDYPDFLFPQMGQEQIAPPEWQPSFRDYLYVAFTNATAFSPTDTMPLTTWAKLLMMTQTAVSLITVLLVVARAVGILQ